jgi:hypothetical protein
MTKVTTQPAAAYQVTCLEVGRINLQLADCLPLTPVNAAAAASAPVQVPILLGGKLSNKHFHPRLPCQHQYLASSPKGRCATIPTSLNRSNGLLPVSHDERQHLSADYPARYPSTLLLGKPLSHAHTSITTTRHDLQQFSTESLIASDRYLALLSERPAMLMRPSMVMYTCHLRVMFSHWACTQQTANQTAPGVFSKHQTC